MMMMESQRVSEDGKDDWVFTENFKLKPSRFVQSGKRKIVRR